MTLFFLALLVGHAYFFITTSKAIDFLLRVTDDHSQKLHNIEMDCIRDEAAVAVGQRQFDDAWLMAEEIGCPFVAPVIVPLSGGDRWIAEPSEDAVVIRNSLRAPRGEA